MPAPKDFGSAVFGGNHCIALRSTAQLEHDIAVAGIAHVVQCVNSPAVIAGFPHKACLDGRNLITRRNYGSRIRDILRSLRTIAADCGLEAIPFIGIGGFHHIAIGCPRSGSTQILAHQHTTVVQVSASNAGIHCIFRIACHIEIGRVVISQINGIGNIAGRTILRGITPFYQDIRSRSGCIALVAVFPIGQGGGSRLVFRDVPSNCVGVIARVVGKFCRSSRSSRFYIIEFLCYIHQLDGPHCK